MWRQVFNLPRTDWQIFNLPPETAAAKSCTLILERSNSTWHCHSGRGSRAQGGVCRIATLRIFASLFGSDIAQQKPARRANEWGPVAKDGVCALEACGFLILL
jgi:hypothetical protein